ncbi:hypothetical protein [Gorillibacterium massiliense]|uniref:hypothetical protein n=1 Tax=Gorillibacterium massiliense TaxID=1280390 RepID=UPI0004B47B6B|nr:hypothetical protein [Gorillibacterium massiliense]
MGIDKPQAEAPSPAKDEMLRLIFENIQDIICYFSPDAICRYCSPSLFRQAGRGTLFVKGIDYRDL